MVSEAVTRLFETGFSLDTTHADCAISGGAAAAARPHSFPTAPLPPSRPPPPPKQQQQQQRGGSLSSSFSSSSSSSSTSPPLLPPAAGGAGGAVKGLAARAQVLVVAAFVAGRTAEASDQANFTAAQQGRRSKRGAKRTSERSIPGESSGGGTSGGRHHDSRPFDLGRLLSIFGVLFGLFGDAKADSKSCPRDGRVCGARASSSAVLADVATLTRVGLLSRLPADKADDPLPPVGKRRRSGSVAGGRRPAGRSGAASGAVPPPPPLSEVIDLSSARYRCDASPAVAAALAAQFKIPLEKYLR